MNLFVDEFEARAGRKLKRREAIILGELADTVIKEAYANGRCAEPEVGIETRKGKTLYEVYREIFERERMEAQNV